MTTLTKKQRQILTYIEEFVASNGYAPSYREIAKHFRLSSTATVFAHVQNLVAKGMLRLEEGSARSIEPAVTPATNDDEQYEGGGIVIIPLAGLITAGEPIEAVEEREQIAIPASLADDSGRFFALKVRGESMIEDGILDGDYVVLERRDSAQNGEIVVALIDNEYATLKRFYKERDHIRLEPANASMEPIRVKNVRVQGRLVGLIRKYR